MKPAYFFRTLLFLLLLCASLAHAAPTITIIKNQDGFVNFTVSGFDSVKFATNTNAAGILSNVSMAGYAVMGLFPFVDVTEGGTSDTPLVNYAVTASGNATCAGGSTCPLGNKAAVNFTGYTFDGTNDKYTLNDNSGWDVQSAFSVCAWVNVTVDSGESSHIFSRSNSPGAGMQLAVSCDGTSPNSYLRVTGDAETCCETNSNRASACNGKGLAYLCGVWNGQNTLAYENGTLLESKSYTASVPSSGTVNIGGVTGSDAESPRGFVGALIAYRNEVMTSLQMNTSRDMLIGYNPKTLSFFVNNSAATSSRTFQIWANASDGSVSTSALTLYSFGSDTTPPSITGYSSQGSSCTNWNTNPSNPCSTADTTPTLYFNTTESAFCAIGRTNVNYTNMGSSRNCTSGEGTTEHACTLTGQDELVYEDSNVSLGCKDASGNENRTSTSGGLSLTITGLEAAGDASLGLGVQNALLSGYTNYTSQQVYARHFNGAQDSGRFDWVAKKGSKAWAFNYVTKGEQHVGMFNITPSLYVLEINNVTSANITKYVELVINATK